MAAPRDEEEEEKIFLCCGQEGGKVFYKEILLSATFLILENNQLTTLPPEISHLINLTWLDLEKNQLTTLPPEIGRLINLTTLILSRNKLTTLPPELFRLTNLTMLSLSGNKLTTLPPEIFRLINMTTLNLEKNQLTTLPPEIGHLINLTTLDLSYNKLTTLPPEIGRLTNLTKLKLFRNPFADPFLRKLASRKGEFGLAPNVASEVMELFADEEKVVLRCGQEGGDVFHKEVLFSDTSLTMSRNKLTTLPPEIGRLTNLTTLDLGGNHLTTLPPEIGRLIKLTTLYLWGNKLTTLPPEIGCLINLTTLILWGNQLTTLPPEIGRLINLKTLDLEKNQLTTLPPEIGHLINLTTLDLGCNQLTTLPPEIGRLINLTMLKLLNNQFADPVLQELASQIDEEGDAANVADEVMEWLADCKETPLKRQRRMEAAAVEEEVHRKAAAEEEVRRKEQLKVLAPAPPTRQSSVAEVCRWLGSIGLSALEQAFTTNEIDGSVLFELTEADMLQIGVTAFGHKKKLLSAIREIHPAPSPSPGVAAAAAPSPAAAATPQQQEGVLGRMSFEQANVGVVPFATFPAGYAPKCSVHAAVARAMGAKWSAAFAATLRGMVDRHAANTQSVRDAIAQHGLSEEEARAIAYYCADARMAEGGTKEMCVFRELNSTLATRMFDKAAAWHDFAVVLDSGLRKLPPFAGEVYRALDRPLTQLSRQYQVGNQVCWVAFTSCSKNKDCLATFAETVGDHQGATAAAAVSKGTWISLKAISARDISELSMFPEDEVLLLPNTVVRVEEIASPEMKALINFPANLDLVRVVEIQDAH